MDVYGIIFDMSIGITGCNKLRIYMAISRATSRK